jgi:hypothetical protein
MLFRLNQVYGDAAEPAERALPKGMEAKVRRTLRERW